MENTQNIDELRKLSGEDQVKQPPRLQLPLVRMHGRKGVFTKIALGTSSTTKEELGEKISGVALKVRRTYGFYSKTRQLYTTENNTQKDYFVLFEQFTNKAGDTTANKIDEGTGLELKVKHPELKVTQVIYFLLYPTNEIVKLQVKGSSFKNLYAYFGDFGKDEHIFEVVTECGKEDGLEDNQGMPYYPMTFIRAGKADIAVVGEKIRWVAEKLQAFEDWSKDKYGENAVKDAVGRETGVPEIDADLNPPQQQWAKDIKNFKAVNKKYDDGQEGDQEIDAKDIPF
jgi:hypothetical protein